mgnify:FL=1
MTFKDKSIFITGGSRGIGLAIAKRLAKDGAHITIASKTDKPHPTLEGTIHTAVAEIEEAGGKGLAVQMDIRDETQVEDAIDQTVKTFGGIDILINNASAIFLAGVSETPMKRFDLMNQVNMRGSYMAAQKALLYLAKADNPHILTLSPPIDLSPRWFENHTAYTLSKYGMSMCTIGLAAEFKDKGIAANSLWPQTLIFTAAMKMIGNIKPENCRSEEIVADAAYAILKRNSSEPANTGNFYIDEDVLKEEGIKDFSGYAIDPEKPLIRDLYLSD